MELDGESHPCTLQTTAFDRVLTFTLGFPDSSVGNESACNAGDPASILGWEDPLEKG